MALFILTGKQVDMITNPPSWWLGPPLWPEGYWVQTQWPDSEHSSCSHWSEIEPRPETCADRAKSRTFYHTCEITSVDSSAWNWQKPLILFYSVNFKLMKRRTESWFWLVCGLSWGSLYRRRRQRVHAIIHTQSQSMWCHFPCWRGCGCNECYFSSMTGCQVFNHQTVDGKQQKR